MDIQELEEGQLMMMEEQLAEREDIFRQFLKEEGESSFNAQGRMQRPSYYRSTRDLRCKESFQKILNTSSSNERIPSTFCNDSSNENSSREGNRMEVELSLDDDHVRDKTFKKKFEESFSVQNTIRNSSSSFSERSDSLSVHNILPMMQKEEEIVLEGLRCNCKKSQCLKLYCECFHQRLFCNQLCNCRGCGNNEQNQKKHKQAVIEALVRNAHGFNEENEAKTGEIKGFSLGVQPDEVRKGCKCKKTKCIKNYCECYQSGVQCTIFCRCQGCFNTTQTHHQKPI